MEGISMIYVRTTETQRHGGILIKVLRDFVTPWFRTSQANWNLPISKEFLQLVDAFFLKMKDRSSESGVGVSGSEHVGEVFECPGAARGDHRNVDGVRYGSRHLAIEPGFRAGAIDRGQQDLAGAATGGLASPFDSITIRN